MPITKLNRKGQYVEEGFEGFFDFITKPISSIVGSISSVVTSVTGDIFDATKVAASSASLSNLTNASSNTASNVVSGTVSVTQGLSSVAANNAASIVANAQAVPSAATNPAKASDIIVQEALRQAATINAATAVIVKPVEPIINDTPIVKEVIPTATAGTTIVGGVISKVPIVGEAGEALTSVPLVGDFVEQSAELVASAPIVGGVAAPLLVATGLIDAPAQKQAGQTTVIDKQYVYKPANPVIAPSSQSGLNLEHPIAVYFK